MSRTRRQPYRKSRRSDRTCRNHGSDYRSRRNRLYSARKAEQAAQAEVKQWERGE